MISKRTIEDVITWQILTASQEDLLYDGDREIKIIPAWKWLTSLP